MENAITDVFTVNIVVIIKSNLVSRPRNVCIRWLRNGNELFGVALAEAENLF